MTTRIGSRKKRCFFLQICLLGFLFLFFFRKGIICCLFLLLSKTDDVFLSFFVLMMLFLAFFCLCFFHELKILLFNWSLDADFTFLKIWSLGIYIFLGSFHFFVFAITFGVRFLWREISKKRSSSTTKI